MTEDTEKIMQELSDISSQFNQVIEEIREFREEYWNSLSKSEQLKCFCAVVERIMKGETEGRSYRGILYDTFEFGPEAYVSAQMSGFMALHNSIFDYNNLDGMLEKFAQFCDVDNPKEKVSEFLSIYTS